ncbi:hypothetical protein E2C01_041701 [Portunus trituberculatus]|uniref:Uncharacterized protein n=1 Tax=Portunus trituberculatus TaxID=210409 RepID=A0A5B7FJX8_PORTR|nr:hypothetical protein [Portunus trituberculatus]
MKKKLREVSRLFQSITRQHSDLETFIVLSPGEEYEAEFKVTARSELIQTRTGPEQNSCYYTSLEVNYGFGRCLLHRRDGGAVSVQWSHTHSTLQVLQQPSPRDNMNLITTILGHMQAGVPALQACLATNGPTRWPELQHGYPHLAPTSGPACSLPRCCPG